MTIFISGGAGFIASHLVERLLNDGHRVICFDSFNSNYDPVAKWKNVYKHTESRNFKVVGGDILDMGSLEKAFSCWRIDAIVHLAALAGVRPSVQSPGLHFNVNVVGTVNVLEMARQNKVAKFVFASSSSVYGNSPTPFREDMPVDKPLCPYAASKRAGELACYTYHHLHGLDVACIRPFTVYGPRQRHEMAIPLFVDAIHNRKELTLNGDSGLIRRDFTYVEDVIEGIVRILDREHGFEIYNLGTGSPVSIRELVYSIESRLGKRAEIKRALLGPGEAIVTWANIDKAREMLGYEPKYDIQTGLDNYIKWYLEDQCPTNALLP